MGKIIIKNDCVFFDEAYAKYLDSLCSIYNFKNNHSKGISIKNFSDFLNKVSDKFHISYNYVLENCDFLLDEFNSILDELESIDFDLVNILSKFSYDNMSYWFSKKNYIDSYVSNNCDSDVFERLVFLFDEYLKFQVKVYKSFELLHLKDSLFEDLKEVSSEDIVKYYEDRYNLLLNEKSFDIDKLEILYREIQEVILDDFKANITDIDDYKPGEPFRFLCHSTNSITWEGDFVSEYVSTSLLTENHTDTYRSPYGFIIDPINIISMDSSDLYANNTAKDESELTNVSVLPKILSIGHLIRDTSDYNEVILKGFNPVAIFCINDGSKEFNPFYIKAKALQNSFPNLPLIDLDMSLYNSFDNNKKNKHF